jgi:general secretion pathway protein M
MKASWLDFKKRYWDARSVQEQKLLKVSVWLLTPLLLYLLLWQPAHSAVSKLQRSVPLLNMEAERLRNQAEEVEMLRHRAKPAMLDAVALKAAVEDSAARNGLREAVSSLELQQPNAVRISFAVVSFAQWLRWLSAMQQEQHIRADSVSVSMLLQPGMVKISATLINGGNQ